MGPRVPGMGLSMPTMMGRRLAHSPMPTAWPPGPQARTPRRKQPESASKAEGRTMNCSRR
uniref:Alternative protein NOS1 n=1 Tax=Homo sapiens TaxID=9606 RepID=L8E6X1_HUMAN|nr:alternative protein NOS1 [Homo sapiens]